MALTNKKTLASLAMVSALISAAALAATPTPSTTTSSGAPSATSTATAVPSSAAKVLDRMTVTFAGTYYGGSVSDPGTSYRRSDWGQSNLGASNGAQRMESTLATLYKLNDKGLVTGLGITSIMTPVMGRGFEFTAPYLKVGHSKLISTGNFNYSADFRTYLPVTSAYYGSGVTARLRSVQVASYDIPNSKFTAGYYLSANYFINNNSAPAGKPRTDVSMVPGVSYQVSPKLALGLDYEMETGSTQEANLLDSKAAGTWLYLGATVTPNDRLSIRPYLTMNPGTKFLSTETAFLTLDLVAKVL